MYALVPAAGVSKRMGSKAVPVGSASLESTTKVFLPLHGEQSATEASILGYTLRILSASKEIAGFVVAVRDEDRDPLTRVLSCLELPEEVQLVSGGESRQGSVKNALAAVPKEVEFVLVHDAARPLCPVALIQQVAKSARESGAAILADPLRDTLKRGSQKNCVVETVSRDGMWAAHTPQVFSRSLLERALSYAEEKGFVGTDESSLVEKLGVDVTLVRSTPRNLKVTTPEDYNLARVLVGLLDEELDR